jgi:hypothetical protein
MFSLHPFARFHAVKAPGMILCILTAARDFRSLRELRVILIKANGGQNYLKTALFAEE